MDFALPEIGEGVYEAELTAWSVKVGDVVKRGQNLMEIMTDKAAMEVPAPFAGTITALRAAAGQTIKAAKASLSSAVTHPAAVKPATASRPMETAAPPMPRSAPNVL